MRKIFLFAFLAAVFAISFASAYHSNWDSLNQDAEYRVAYNRMYDYFKYGSYWQNYGQYPVYPDYSYSYDYHFPRGYGLEYNYHFHRRDYGGTKVNVYDSYPKRPYGRLHAGDRAYVVNCGYADGFYRDCY